jgi:hypothetical protein
MKASPGSRPYYWQENQPLLLQLKADLAMICHTVEAAAAGPLLLLSALAAVVLQLAPQPLLLPMLN